MASKVVDLAERQTQSRDQARNKGAANWKGELDADELALPGGLLFAALVDCARQRKHGVTQLAAELKVTYGYIAQLRNGNRDVSLISDEFAKACAEYLGTSLVTVLMLSGRLTPKDYFNTQETMVSEVNRAFDYMCTDPVWSATITPELRASSVESRYAVVRLYEKAVGKVLMDKATDMFRLATEVSAMLERKEKLAATSTAPKRGRGRPSKKEAIS